MQSHWTLNLKNGLKVNVPADLENPVTLTLLELEDWPEPDYAFWCQLAQPGLRVLDADTGYGLYALGLAQALHGQGRVLALNPDPLFARSVADNGLQALIQTEEPSEHASTSSPSVSSENSGETDSCRSETNDDGSDHGEAAAFDLIRLGPTTKLDPGWIQQAAPLLMLPSDSAALADLQAAGLSLYRLIPVLNALVLLQDAPVANCTQNGSPDLLTNADTNHEADGETAPSAGSGLEKPATLYACNATRAAWLRGQERMIRPA
ncbi:hypothetical protein [Halochromatium glycolicum]|uniref:Methyltransferase n=1 Tax=Halochromatium glycolicum TaxID=85075 RepID=A0AAJ0U155_9GAMM|nr:hypothetical protein [Halochromatium glycolicum]MBK1703359.1 hypothetical protein [Halochromatium glycolicum]